MKDAQVRLTSMVCQMISDGNLKFAQLLRNALVDKVPAANVVVYLHTYLHTYSGKYSKGPIFMLLAVTCLCQSTAIKTCKIKAHTQVTCVAQPFS